MRIDRIEAFRVSLPLVHQFQTSSHAKTHLEHILVKVTDADGAVGWGEVASPSGPYYTAETVDTCWFMHEKYLAPAVLGARWDRPGEVPDLWGKVRGFEFAKAGLDMAAWVLWTTVTGTSLATALGGTRPEVTAGVSMGIEPTIDDLLAQIAKQDEAGYPRVKLKIMPGWDVEPVRAVKEAFGHLQVHVDANGVYTESPEHTAVFDALDGEGLVMIEQPYAPRALAAHARLQARLSTPVCLDESVVTLDDLDTALYLKAGRVLNIKVSRMGGLTAAVEAHARASAAGLDVWCGAMHEFGIGRAANVALSSLPGFTLPSDVSGSDKYYTRDVVTPPIRANRGQVTVPTTVAGLGHEVDEEFIRQTANATLDQRARLGTPRTASHPNPCEESCPSHQRRPPRTAVRKRTTTRTTPRSPPGRRRLVNALALIGILTSLVAGFFVETPTVWGLVIPIVMYFVLTLLGMDLLVATIAVLLSAVLLAQSTPAQVGVLLGKATADLVTIIGFVIVLGAGACVMYLILLAILT